MTTRRNYLRGFGIAAGAASVGGFGVYFATDRASAASTSNINITDPSSVTTDDGSVEYIAYKGDLQYDWEGAEKQATYGRAKLSGALYDSYPDTSTEPFATKDWADEIFEIGIEGVRRYGTLGRSMPDSPTTTGSFKFSSFGAISDAYDSAEMPEPICVIAASSDLQSAADSSGFVSPSSAYTDPNTNADGDPRTNTTGGYTLVDDLFALSNFRTETDRDTKTVHVQLEFTGQVFQSDPTQSSATPAAPPATATGSFEVSVTNRGALVSASESNGHGVIGANQE